MKKCTLLACCLGLWIPTHALQITVGGITYDDYGSGTIHEGRFRNVAVVSVSSNISGNLVIPSLPAQFGEGLFYFRVTEIAQRAFQGNTKITAVTLPNTLQTIRNQAFQNCTNLTAVTIPTGIVGNHAFSFCTNLTAVNLGDGVTRIDEGSFSECTNLTAVVVGDAIQSVGNEAFIGCENLNSVTFGKELVSVGERIFERCENLDIINVSPENQRYSSVNGILFNKEQTELVQFPRKRAGFYAIPEGVTEINPTSFTGCKALTSVSIPASLVSGLDNEMNYTNAFEGCIRLSEYIVDEANPAYMAYEGIVYTKSRTTLLTCPVGKESDHLTLPEGVTHIGRFAFIGCSKIRTLSLPASVTDIYYNSFRNCTALTQFQVEITNPVYSSEQGVLFTKSGTALVAYPPNKEGATYSIPNFVTEIKNGAFMTAVNLQTILLHEGINSLGDFAFWECENLTSVTLPASLLSIGEGAFLYATNLKDVYVSWENPTLTEVFAVAFLGIHTNSTLHVPVGTMEIYQSLEPWMDFAVVIDDFETAMPDLFIAGVGIYPTLVQDGFYVEHLSATAHLTVIDLSGKKILTTLVSPGRFISFSSYPPGIYFVILKNGDQKVQHKIRKL